MLQTSTEISGMRSSLISKQISAISTPRLTPLKMVMNEQQAEGVISRLDIEELEKKIKGIEAQIGEVKVQQTSVEIQDFSTQIPKLPEVENTDGYTLEKAISRLFQFIEIESNISLDKLEGTYQALKQKIHEKLQEQYDIESEDEI